jgi:hypothetical protein
MERPHIGCVDSMSKWSASMYLSFRSDLAVFHSARRSCYDVDETRSGLLWWGPRGTSAPDSYCQISPKIGDRFSALRKYLRTAERRGFDEAYN